jgi:hypothetical protein
MALVSIMAAGCGNLEEYSTPTEVFEATFGAKPGPTVRGLQAYGRAFRDNSMCCLRFQVPRSQLNALLGTSFTTLTGDEFAARISNAGISGPIPVWWKPLAGTSTVFLESGAFPPGFTQSQALVSYDPTSRTAHVYWDGSD